MTGSDSGTVQYRQVILLLNLINVTQPVNQETLLESMSEENGEAVLAAIDLLVAQGLVKRLPDHYYRATWMGQESQSSRVMRRNRDVHRMWHLSNLSDQCRKTGEGEPS